MNIHKHEGQPRVSGRQLSYVAFAVIVIAYLAIIQFGGHLVEGWSNEDDTLTTRGVIFTMVIPLGLALIFTYGVIAALGWWRPVLKDDRPVNRWVWVVPAILLVAILVGIDYSALAEKGWMFVLVLLIATQIVGWGEEGMFRGIGVTMLRNHGLREGKVALWSSLIFGAVHLSNAFGSGASAVPQAIIVSLAGYFFYLTRRVSGSNALNSILHGLFDFALISGSVILLDQTSYVGAIAPILAYPIIAIVLLVKRHKIEPSQTTDNHTNASST
ncbi:CPBP family intramembrane glutamic endopeptidase [Rhodococcus erythropolis]|uniref:CPBP family intramembrane glutamic endopeptidase n=1 Tax=Rhodococcus erythropolis TaxID=1833 RepID=A0AAX4A002_RHOER|nr:CPBP family intramembrane glutamic endopeptidase [Rhodococcus erythropolis]WMN01819.1 CPBP family intramembrane glutamic endopeptidase [Rhodococcus erythropolis]